MHFFVLGATGRTGSVIVDECLKRGHTVSALLRDPDAVAPKTDVTLYKGTPMAFKDVDAAIGSTGRPVDGVIVALNLKRKSGSPFAEPVSPPNLMEQSVSNVAEAMRKRGVRKLVVMSAAGVGDSFVEMAFWLRLLLKHSQMGPQFEDHDAAHRAVKNDQSIDSVFVRPMRLTESAAKEVKEWGSQGKGVGGMANISIASVAHFMVDAAEQPKWNRQTPVITN